MILGSLEEPDYANNVTFGCRMGEVENSDEPAATVVEGGAVRSDSAIFGKKLGREAALSHPRLRDFWDVVGWLVVNDPMLHPEMYYFGGQR